MADERTKRVVVGMSGGVDSSVAALRLLDRGYAVEGVFMKNWEEDDRDGVCMAAEDLRDAQQVSDQLGITLHTVNFATEYWDRVFRHFLDEYRAGRTPNPDVLCNREIKFRAFLEHARGLGADYIATGHYARIARTNGRLQLAKGADAGKDQSYFLYMLDQEQLASSLFPLGDLQKDTVRGQAKEAGFSNHRKKDSTGICFIGERRLREFLGRFLPARAGEICTPDGRVVGRHDGLMYYTIGQRKGLGIGGQAGAPEEAWYVVGKDLERNALQVAQGHDHALLYSKELAVSRPLWIDGNPPPLPLRCNAKIRYRQSDQPCSVHRENHDRWRVVFDLPQWAAAPGQSVVFYQNDICLGGGIILDSTGDGSERVLSA